MIQDAPQVGTVLVVEDDAGMRSLLSEILREAGHRVETAADGHAGLEALRRAQPDVLVTDLKMPRLDGMALLRRVSVEAPEVPVIVLTAFGTVEGAVEAMRLGAFDYLSKPLPDPAALREVVARALSARQGAGGETPGEAPQGGGQGAGGRGRGARTTGPKRRGPPGPVYADPAFAEVMALVDAVAPRDTTVLVTGESGVGKEVVARALHDRSPRASGPFVAVNCAALPETLLESELFGHEKGAFTGATTSHPGLFEQASGGTLLLDEIGEMAPGLQAKLLRVLETRRVMRLGATREREVDVRLVAATNRDLGAEVAAGRFRQDLLYRLKVFPIAIPPLRERPGDILPLARHFLALLSAGPGRTPATLSPAAEQALCTYQWPGNVRELMNAIERATILAGREEIRPEHLGIPAAPGLEGGAGPAAGGRPDAAGAAASTRDGSSAGQAGVRSDPAGSDRPAASGRPMTLKEMERQAILEALEAVGGNRRKAARRLGIALRTLQYKIKAYDIPPDVGRR